MPRIFRPFDRNPDALRFRRHPLFRLLGLRGTIAQHSEAEERILQKYARGRRTLVEIGVAEGASALTLRMVADAKGVLYLVDPYPAGRIPGINLTRLCAHLHVSRSKNATVRYIEDFSHNASRGWEAPIDFLFVDGDHAYDACRRDWNEWSPFVVEGGIIAFHDARLFPGGWTREDWGPVRVVNELFRDSHDPRWRIIDEVDSLVVVRRL